MIPKWCRHCMKEFTPQNYAIHVRKVLRHYTKRDKITENSLAERLLELNHK